MPLGRSPTDTRSAQPELRAFLLHLASERGLAENSLHAYRRDLEDIERFLMGIGSTLVTASGDEFRAYLRDQTQQAFVPSRKPNAAVVPPLVPLPTASRFTWHGG